MSDENSNKLIEEIEEFLQIKDKLDKGIRDNASNILCPHCYRFYFCDLARCNHCLKPNPYI